MRGPLHERDSISLSYSRLLIRIWRTLAKGRPVSGEQIDQMIADLGLNQDEAGEFLTGVTERDSGDSIVGIFGLSLNDHPHRFSVNGASLTTWCAEDAKKRRLVIVLAAIALMNGASLFNSGSASAADPTCSGTPGIDIANHGQHIVGDYVSGTALPDLGWPPSGGVVGEAIGGEGGAVLPGGPGPGFHFPEGVAPGASFCLSQSQSPGAHPGP